jgi:hypothetical protein
MPHLQRIRRFVAYDPPAMSVSATARSRPRLRIGLGEAALLAVLAAGAAIVAWEQRGLTFVGDDWSFLLDRRGHGIDVFLQPHTEHLSAGPILAYKALLQVFGATSYRPYALLSVALSTLVAALVYVAARPRVGPWAALAPAAVLATFGPGWNDLLWGFQAGYFGSLAAGVGVFVALDRRDRLGDALACALLVVSLSWASIGVGVLVGAAVELLLLRRSGGLRRLWVVGIPLALYALWYAKYGVSTAKLGNLKLVASYLADSLAAGLASLTGLARLTPNNPFTVTIEWGRPLALAAVAFMAIWIARGRPVSARAWALGATAAALWLATAISFVAERQANSSRYQYISATFLALAIAELARGWRPSRRAGLLLAAFTAFAVAANLSVLDEGAKFWRSAGRPIRAEIGALEIARPVADPSFAVEDGQAAAVIGNHFLSPVVAQRYFSAVDAFGSPADSPAEIARRPEDVREKADYVLAHAERLRLRSLSGLPGGGCQVHAPRAGVVELQAGGGTTLALRAGHESARVAARRFADVHRYVTFPRLDPEAAAALAFPRDRASAPWTVRVQTRAPVTVCAAPA